MVFSSQIFLFLFLPIVLFLYYFIKKEYRNNFLTLASLVFFAWGGLSYSLILIFSIITNYLVGLWLDKTKDNPKSKLILSLGVVLNLGVLGVFKYFNFIIDNVNGLISIFEIPPLDNDSIILPVGISFYTFQALSYLVDVYREDTPVQKNIGRLGLYIALFPQLIAGPIVRYHDINLQLENRAESFEKFSSGVERFIIGLGKKVLLANSFALIADIIFIEDPTTMSSITAWTGIIAYSLQIYFDFSGYSDMAIGLGRMFGFEFLENFNLPYVAKSIRDFWRRWHISLSTWFRDYLYIPLGGSKVKKGRVYLNLFIVFLLTGFWHGASWSFIFWGLFHGTFLIIERAGFSKFLDKIWRPFSHVYTLLIVLIGWVFFRADDLDYALGFIGSMFGGGNVDSALWMFNEHVHEEVVYVFWIGVLGALGVFSTIQKWIKNKVPLVNSSVVTIISEVIFSVGVLTIFLLSLMNLAADSYNPFIYFRF